MKAFTHVSASQISTYLSCQRQWWWNKVFGLPTTQKASAALGEAVHASIEAYLGGERTLHPVAVPGRKKLDELRALEPLVEAKMERRLDNGLVFVGRIDLMVPQHGLVVDHKTTSSLQYAKTEEELRADVQMLAYAYEVLQRQPGQEVRVAHNVLLTKGSGHRYTETTIPAPAVLEGWKRIREVTDRMKVTAKVEAPDQVPATWTACDKYGGCDFRDKCRAMKLASSSSPYDGVTDAPSSPTMEVNTMSNKHTASVLRSMGLDDQTILAAIRKGTCVDDVGLAGPAVTPTPTPAAINPPEAPVNPRVEKTEPVVSAPSTLGKSPEDILRDQMKYLLSLGWSQEDIDLLSDNAFTEAVKKGYQRTSVEVVLGTGLVQGAEYEDVIVGFQTLTPAPVAKRPSRSPVAVAPLPAPVVEEPVVEAPVVEEPVAVVEEKPRRKKTAAPAPAPVVEEPVAVVEATSAPLDVVKLPPTSVGLHLYIDCLPERGVTVTDLATLLSPYIARVEAEGYRDEKTGKTEKVAHYGLIPYNNGEKMVIGFMLSDLVHFRSAGAVYVDSRLPLAARALEVLRPLATIIVRGLR